MSNTISLSETTKFIVDNRGKTAPTEVDGIALIATNCINNENLYPVFNKVRYVSEETYNNWFRSHPKPGDILLTLKGSQNGAVCLVPDIVDFVIAQDMVGLRVNGDIIDHLFLFAALRSNSIQHQIKMLDVSGVIPHLKKSDFDKLILPFPDRSTQEEIGKIYYNLSKKVDLLHRQNKTLEAMAETLFRQWFVEEAEEDWENAILGDFIQTNIYTIKKDYPFKEIEYLDTGSLTDDKIEELKVVSLSNAPSRAKRIVKHNNVLYSTVRPNQRHYGLIQNPKENLVVSTGFCVIDCHKISPFFVYKLLTTKEMTEYLHSIAEGSTSTYPSLKPSDLEVIEFKLPNEKLLEKYSNYCSDAWAKIYNNKLQIKTLKNLRDTLLPKLMSGEVRVNLN